MRKKDCHKAVFAWWSDVSSIFWPNKPDKIGPRSVHPFWKFVVFGPQKRQIFLGFAHICGVGWREHITPYRERLGWLNLEGRRAYFAAVLLYKAVRMGEPPYLAALFQKNQDRTSARRADARELLVPGACTNTGFHSFRISGARLWNAIPRSIRCLPSLKHFKTNMSRHLLQTHGVRPIN